MSAIQKLFTQVLGYIPGNRILFFIFLLFMALLVPFVKWLDLWQVSIAIILLFLFAIFKNKKFGVACVWFSVAIALHNIYAFLLLIIGFKLGIYLLP